MAASSLLKIVAGLASANVGLAAPARADERVVSASGFIAPPDVQHVISQLAVARAIY
jgi:hypothetical protein